jgi:hypothetical protein
MNPLSPNRGPHANPMQQHTSTLQRDFATFDTAKETVKGKPWFGGGADNIVSREDLQVVRDNPGRFTPAQVEAARFFLDDPSALGRLDTAARTGEPIPDNRIGPQDVNAALRDAGDFAGAATFVSQRPAIAADASTAEQAAAASTLLARRAVPGVDADSPAQLHFSQMLQEHQGDARWLHGYFRALGAEGAGTLLHGALAGGGDRRTQAREALRTLQHNGLLTDIDLASGRFKTTPWSEETFSLKTLLDADRIQQTVEARHQTMDKTGSAIQPDNTTPYDAYDALLTVNDPQNRAKIQEMADRYGIDPALLAGTVAAEMDFDHDRKDVLQDGFWRLGLRGGQGPGITSVHDSGLAWAADYLERKGLKGADEAQAFRRAGRDEGADVPQAIESAAIVLAALTDVRQSHGASVSRPEDMATTWAAFRTGIGGIGMPNGDTGKPLAEGQGGYPNLQAFLGNRIPAAAQAAGTAGDPHLEIGGNAYQSEPYFEVLTRDA